MQAHQYKRALLEALQDLNWSVEEFASHWCQHYDLPDSEISNQKLNIKKNLRWYTTSPDVFKNYYEFVNQFHSRHSTSAIN